MSGDDRNRVEQGASSLGDRSINGEKVVDRARVSAAIRLSVITAVIDGRLNGAQAALSHEISEATVHRILKAERQANPSRFSNRVAEVRHEVRRSVEAQPERRSRRALTVEQESKIVERLYSGADMATDLAREFGVHKSTISRLLRAAKAQSADRPVATYDPIKRKKRVAEGVARAAANGRVRGRKSQFSPETQDRMAREVFENGATYAQLASEYQVDPSTISRIVRRRRSGLSDNKQSLMQIFSDLIGGEGGSPETK